jgi:ATP:ADP antiporter, AAA family
VDNVHRKILLPCIYGAVAVILVLIGLELEGENVNLIVGAFSYVWIGGLNLMLVSVFWSFLLEMFPREKTKRLFSLIAAGGTLGSLVGSFTTSMPAKTLGESGILYLAAGGFVCAIVCQRILLRIWQPPGTTAAATSDRGRGFGGNLLPASRSF